MHWSTVSNVLLHISLSFPAYAYPLLTTSSFPSAQALTDNPSRYPCIFQGCLHTSARPYDLAQHLKSHYPETVSKLECPYARGGFCGREGQRGFTREDHRKEHVRKVHPSRERTSKESKEDVSKSSIPIPTGPRKRLEKSTRTLPISIPSGPPRRSRGDELVLPFRNPTVPYSVGRQHVWDHKVLVEEQERPIAEEQVHSNSNEKEHSTAENEKRSIAKNEERSNAKSRKHSIVNKREYPVVQEDQHSEAEEEEHSEAEEEELSIVVEEEHSIAGRSTSIQDSISVATMGFSKTSMGEVESRGYKSRSGNKFKSLLSQSLHTRRDHDSSQDMYDDIQSLPSDKDDIESRPPRTRSSYEAATEVYMTNLFAENRQLRPLYEEALSVLGRDRFINHFLRLLERYYVDLSLSAETEFEKAITQLLKSRWRRTEIAMQTVHIFRPASEETRAEWDRNVKFVQHEEGTKVENWLADNNDVPPPELESQTCGTDEEDNPRETRHIMSARPHTVAMEKFLIESEAFRNLVTRFSILLLPQNLQSLLRVIMTIPSNQLWTEKSAQSSLFNRLKISIEEFTQESWNWWPFRPRLQALQGDQTRLHWSCVSTCLLKHWYREEQLKFL